MKLTKLQQVLVTIIAATTVISIGYGGYCHFAKAADLDETNQAVAMMSQSIEKVDLRAEVKFIYYRLDRLENDYFGKDKDIRYHEKKRSLDRQLKDVEDRLKQLKEK